MADNNDIAKLVGIKDENIKFNDGVQIIEENGHTTMLISGTLSYPLEACPKCGVRKIDVETIFDRLKGVFGMRRAHVRGKQALHNNIGIMLMSMNLTKLALEARRRVATFYDYSATHKNRNESIRISMVSLRFFYLRLVFFPAPFNINYNSDFFCSDKTSFG